MPDTLKKTPLVRFPFKLAAEQRAALHALAERRNTNAAAVLREFIEKETGVADPLRRRHRLASSPYRDRPENAR
jgi:hypothetical protein